MCMCVYFVEGDDDVFWTVCVDERTTVYIRIQGKVIIHKVDHHHHHNHRQIKDFGWREFRGTNRLGLHAECYLSLSALSRIELGLGMCALGLSLTAS